MPTDTQTPTRIAFVHLMRTGGTTLAHFLSRELADTHLICNSWDQHLKRDWTEPELLEFAQQPGPIFVHNHVVDWSYHLVRVFRRSRFRFITIVRPIGDQLCSLYYWLWKRRPDLMTCSLDNFIAGQLRGDDWKGINKQHWEIPKWWRDIDFVRPLSDEGLYSLIVDDLNLAPNIAEELTRNHENRSPNPGYRQALLSGLITPETDRLLKNSIAQQRFAEIAEQHFGGLEKKF